MTLFTESSIPNWWINTSLLALAQDGAIIGSGTDFRFVSCRWCTVLTIRDYTYTRADKTHHQHCQQTISFLAQHGMAKMSLVQLILSPDEGTGTDAITTHNSVRVISEEVPFH